MSATTTTVKELIDHLSQYPEDMLVVSIHPEAGDWDVEGTVDGVRVSEICGYEVRSGWHVLEESETDLGDPYAECVRLLLVHNFSADIIQEWQDTEFRGPSKWAMRKR